MSVTLFCKNYLLIICEPDLTILFPGNLDCLVRLLENWSFLPNFQISPDTLNSMLDYAMAVDHPGDFKIYKKF